MRPNLWGMRPVIGISTRPRVTATSGGDLGIDSVQHAYRDSVARAGGIPLPLGPVDDDDLEILLDRIDGVVLTGGGDISPDAYGGRAHDDMYGIDKSRDEFEFAIARATRRRRMPVLAICRGLQVVNVALGGTLIEDIPSEIGSTDHSLYGQDNVFEGHQVVTLDPQCLVRQVVGTDTLLVNSIHHQAVRDLAEGFTAKGWTDDGVIEVIQSDDAAWPLLAVQWHPEYLSDAGDPPSQALFEQLVKNAVAFRHAL